MEFDELLELLEIDSPDDFAAAQEARMALLLSPVEAEPVLAILADWVDAETVSEEEDRTELDRWEPYPASECRLCGVV